MVVIDADGSGDVRILTSAADVLEYRSSMGDRRRTNADSDQRYIKEGLLKR